MCYLMNCSVFELKEIHWISFLIKHLQMQILEKFEIFIVHK